MSNWSQEGLFYISYYNDRDCLLSVQECFLTNMLHLCEIKPGKYYAVKRDQRINKDVSVFSFFLFLAKVAGYGYFCHQGERKLSALLGNVMVSNDNPVA
jgi:hypothetical protein